MVSQKKRSKEGIFLIRKTVKEGDEIRHMMSVGAGIQLLQPTPDPDEVITTNEVPEQPETEPIVQHLSASIIAAKRHILRVNSPHGKLAPTVSEKLNRRLSTCPTPFVRVEPPPVIPAEEFLAGTPIFYKASLALQSRSGGYLTFHDSSIDATSRVAVGNAQFVIMNADNVGDDGNMKYGHAVWLVVDNKRVLGSAYTGIGEGRRLSPALIKCSKAHQFKAHHIGRWILMNRDDPIGKMGRNSLHGDRIMLEQEWMFLSSSSPNDVALYKTKSTIANATDKPAYNADYFEPIEDCTFRVRLVAQKDMGTTDGRKRTHLIQRANTQLVTSLRGRWKLKDDLFGLLSEKMDKKVEAKKVNRSLRHKLSNKLEQEHLMKLYHELSSNNFRSPQLHTPSVKDSDSENEENNRKNEQNVNNNGISSPTTKTSLKPLIKQNSDSSTRDTKDHWERTDRTGSYSPVLSVRGRRRKEATNAHGLNYNRLASTLNLERMENNYWRIAQKLLVKTDAWSVLGQSMSRYYDGPYVQMKIKAATIIQRFVREHCTFAGMLGRRMVMLDKASRTKLFMKSEWKNDFRDVLLERKENEINQKKVEHEQITYGEDVENRKLNSPFSFRLLANQMSHDVRDSSNNPDNDDDSTIMTSLKSVGTGKTPTALQEFMSKNFASTLSLPQKPGEKHSKPLLDGTKPPEFLDCIQVTQEDRELFASRPPMRRSISYNPASASGRAADLAISRLKGQSFFQGKGKDCGVIPERPERPERSISFCVSSSLRGDGSPRPLTAFSPRPFTTSTATPRSILLTSPRPGILVSPRPSTAGAKRVDMKEGMTPRDITPTGITPSGMTPRAPTGVTPVGMTPRSASARGARVINTTGMTPRGVSFLGLPPTGMTPSVIAPSGMTPIGTTPSVLTPTGMTPRNITPPGPTGMTPRVVPVTVPSASQLPPMGMGFEDTHTCSEDTRTYTLPSPTSAPSATSATCTTPFPSLPTSPTSVMSVITTVPFASALMSIAQRVQATQAPRPRPQSAHPRLQQPAPKGTYSTYSFSCTSEMDSTAYVPMNEIKEVNENKERKDNKEGKERKEGTEMSYDTETTNKKIEKDARRRVRHEAREKRHLEKRKEEKELISRLSASTNNHFGLPADVFENMHGKVSSQTGFNFLKTASLNPTIYKNKKTTSPKAVFYPSMNTF